MILQLKSLAVVKSTEPIPIAVSACLLGWAVRYDGRDKAHAGVRFLFASGEFVPVPVCPEVMAGLGVPRPPVELVRAFGVVRALGVSDRSLDVTGPLIRQAVRWSAQASAVAGLVCKSRSPSCGLEVALHDQAGRAVGMTEGLFIQVLRRRRSQLPIVEETALEDPEHRAAFLDRVRAFAVGR